MNCPHCAIEISEHPASRCLNAWVAVEVMGLAIIVHSFGEYEKPEYRIGGFDPNDEAARVSPYSANVAAAWKVVEKFDESLSLQGPESVDLNEYYWVAHQWEANLTTDSDNQGSALTAPLAICRAAIKATQ